MGVFWSENEYEWPRKRLGVLISILSLHFNVIKTKVNIDPSHPSRFSIMHPGSTHGAPIIFLEFLHLGTPTIWKRWNITQKHFWSLNWIVLPAEKIESWSHISEHRAIWLNHANTWVKPLVDYMKEIFLEILLRSVYIRLYGTPLAMRKGSIFRWKPCFWGLFSPRSI